VSNRWVSLLKQWPFIYNQNESFPSRPGNGLGSTSGARIGQVRVIRVWMYTMIENESPENFVDLGKNASRASRTNCPLWDDGTSCRLVSACRRDDAQRALTVSTFRYVSILII
jgi:hypothetical protein